ncbi:MAG TPA: glycosyltransferase [Acetobacteraceae bacterium]
MARAVLRIELETEDGSIGPAVVLGPGAIFPSRRQVPVFVPADAGYLHVRVIGPADKPLCLRVTCRPLGRISAGLALAGKHPLGLATVAARGVASDPRGTPARLRVWLGLAATRNAPRPSYALWTKLFDTWTDEDRERLRHSPRRAEWPLIDVLILPAARTPALRATCASIEASILPVATHLIDRDTQGLAAVLTVSDAEYCAILQPGEILPAHAVALLADRAVSLGRPAILYADEDRIGRDGRRYAPQFKPAPSRTLMLSGTLATGVWLVRRDHLAGFSPGSEAWAETLRMDAWLRLHEAGRAGESHRVPFVLTHRRSDTKMAPAPALAAVASAHLRRTGLPAAINAGRPLRLSFAASRAARPKVTIIVPSTCRSPHARHCLSAVLSRTDYAEFELLLVVMGRSPLDPQQRQMIDHLESDRRVRHLLVEAASFNYAIANNRGAAASDSALICLLNDDVAPDDPGWLAVLAGHLADLDIGVAGGRLCYPDHTIQHAGIVLLPDGTGDHVHRFRSCRAPGYAWRARLSQEVSAVTGACLLTRRDLWTRLGGLDESYASAFNDVDFCLRAREAGAGVVLAADATLIHAESLSFGKHYGPDEQTRNLADRARLRARFPEMFRADPFHNPNLALSPGNCWSPAFPPRVTRFDGP